GCFAHRDLESGRSRAFTKRKRGRERRFLSVPRRLDCRGRCRRNVRDSTGRLSSRRRSYCRRQRAQSRDDLHRQAPFPPLDSLMFRSTASDQIEAWRDQFQHDGYLVLPGYFSPAEIDAVLAATDATLRSRPMEVVVDSLLDGERTFYALARNPEARHFKFNDLYLLLDEVRAIALEAGLSELLRALLGAQPPVLCNSLTFAKGGRA